MLCCNSNLNILMNIIKNNCLYDEIYKWLNIPINRRNEIEAFVIIPNHLHLPIFINETENINMLLANGKRFLAYEIIKCPGHSKYLIRRIQRFHISCCHAFCGTTINNYISLISFFQNKICQYIEGFNMKHKQ